ncbi:hypothetical protein [Demequina globuliformis]|uniref:hypothetical protein n=1 Tax=Demequina globuliformis TaxID=676202 RepID=UPI000A462C0E|nr:hypothetical protein [Demequina globuliformis]
MRMRPDFHASWAEADAKFEEFVASIPKRREQLRTLMAATGGPELDGTPASLQQLNDWAIEFGLSDQDDAMDWWPLWLYRMTPEEQAQKRTMPVPDKVYRRWELTGIYFADMCLAQDPTLQWVCWRGDHPIHIKNARFVLDQGLATDPWDVLQIGNVGVVRAINQRELSPDIAHPEPTRLYDWYSRWVSQRHHLYETKPRSWQAAPTGRKANKRIPHHPGDFGQNHLP